MNRPKIDKKTVKYGSASIVLAAVFIALIIIANLVVTAFTDRFNLFVDLTQEELYTVSEATDKLLENIGDQKIKFIFFTPLDELDSNERTKSIKSLALEYEEKYPNVTIEYMDMMKNPGLVAKYRKNYSNLSATSIVVESEKTFAAFDMQECFVYMQNANTGSYEYYAFNAEYRFTSAILKVTRDKMPKALFTTNHLEEIPTQFKLLLEDAGFEVQTVNLLQSDIPEDTKLVVINDPQTDFTGLETEEIGQSEITKLSKYLNNGGNVMVLMDPDTPELKNLDELCQSWGIQIAHGLTLTDDSNSIQSSGSQAIIARYDTNEEYSVFHKALSSRENPISTVMYKAAPMQLLPVTDVTHTVGPILTTYATAKVHMSNQDYSTGMMPLLAAGCKNTYNSELGETVKNYLIVSSSTWFASDTALGNFQVTYGNYELLKNIIGEITDETMILNVNYKVYNDTALTVSTAVSQKWMTVLIFVLPAIVLIAALGVYLKRRHL